MHNTTDYSFKTQTFIEIFILLHRGRYCIELSPKELYHLFLLSFKLKLVLLNNLKLAHHSLL